MEKKGESRELRIESGEWKVKGGRERVDERI
jgi:hypothetical protein